MSDFRDHENEHLQSLELSQDALHYLFIEVAAAIINRSTNPLNNVTDNPNVFPASEAGSVPKVFEFKLTNLDAKRILHPDESAEVIDTEVAYSDLSRLEEDGEISSSIYVRTTFELQEGLRLNHVYGISLIGNTYVGDEDLEYIQYSEDSKKWKRVSPNNFTPVPKESQPTEYDMENALMDLSALSKPIDVNASERLYQLAKHIDTRASEILRHLAERTT